MAFSEYIWWLVIIAVASYLIGSVNISITFSKIMKKDIRSQGSGNPGTLNMSRTFGMGVGVLILFLDIMKGVLPTVTAKLLFDGKFFAGTNFEMSDLTSYLAGTFVVLGHIFPIFYKFKGGKGIATTIGVFSVGHQPIGWYLFALSWVFGIIAIVFILLTAIGSMGSFIATTPPALCALITLYYKYKVSFEASLNQAETAYFIIVNMLILTVVFLTFFAHRKNIQKLLSGTEHTTDWLRMIKDKKLKKKVKIEGEK